MDIQAQAQIPLGLTKPLCHLIGPAALRTTCSLAEGIESMAYRRRTKTAFSWWQLVLMLVGVIAIFSIWQHLNVPVNATLGMLPGTPTMPARLTRADLMPTLTPNVNIPLRQIIFPAAKMVATIIESYRVGDSWEVRHLGDSVGHLAGTGWMDETGGNIALAGHAEDAEGKPGPFAFLSQAKIGDLIILRDGEREIVYHVFMTVSAAPEDIQFVAQDDRRLLTLITCSDWDSKTATYLNRLVVIAVPSG
jgi:LPXTG-site transpeptidase (sortase) family protein